MGKDMRVEIVNNAYGQLIGREPAVLIGRPIFEVIPEAAPDFQPIIDAVFSTGQPLRLFEHPYRVLKGEGEIKGYLNLAYQPFRVQNGQINGVIVLCQDVTEHVSTQKNMETALERLRLSQEAAQMGMFDMDLIQGTMEWDSRCGSVG